MDASRWLVRPRPLPGAGWQLFCFPPAGGGVSMYASWASALAPAVELTAVCPPGRERNLASAPHRQMAPLVDELIEVLAARVRRPYAFFGHSFGAAVAFELATRLCGKGTGPQHLFASACVPPHLPRPPQRAHLLDDGELIRELTRHGGIPAGLLEEPAVLQLVLPAIRADLEIVAGYQASGREPLPCGITALGGLDDTAVTVDDLAGWGDLARGPFRRRLLRGGHFYILTQRAAVLDAIIRDLADTDPALIDHHAREAQV